MDILNKLQKINNGVSNSNGLATEKVEFVELWKEIRRVMAKKSDFTCLLENLPISWHAALMETISNCPDISHIIVMRRMQLVYTSN